MPTLYPFDPTGILPSNRIQNEVTTITTANGVNAYVIVPQAAPFYGTSLSIVNSSGLTLQQNVDYYLTHHWQQATDHTGIEVYGTITLLSGYPVDTYRLNYQTIGGEYVSSPANTIASGIAAANGSYLIVDWASAPTAFPAIPHSENLSGITGVTQLYQALYGISAAIKSPPAGIHYDDIQDINNVYALSIVDPLLQTMQSAALNNDAMGELILDTMATLSPILAATTIAKDLQNYVIPLPGGFVLKVGRLPLAKGGEPSSLTFPGVPFTNQCLYVNCKIGFASNTATISTDTITTGIPNTIGVPIAVTYQAGFDAELRSITYLALGI